MYYWACPIFEWTIPSIREVNEGGCILDEGVDGGIGKGSYVPSGRRTRAAKVALSVSLFTLLGGFVVLCANTLFLIFDRILY